MNVIKFLLGVVFVVALVLLVQLPEAPLDSPAVQFQRLPDVATPRAAETGNSFENLAGSTVADSAVSGELPSSADPMFTAALERMRPITTVFAPAEGAIALAKAAQPAINPALLKQLNQTLAIIQSD